MAKNSSVNLDITSNAADGFDVSGGVTRRKFTITGGDVTVSGVAGNTYKFPSASDTLVGRVSVDSLTNKTLVGPAISNAIFGAGATVAGSAPFYLTSGFVMATSESGAVEYDGALVYFTYRGSGSRRKLAVADFNRPTTNYSTVSGTLQPVTGLTIPIDANEVWAFEAHISCASTTSAGMRFGIGGPAGSSVEAQVAGAGADETSNARNERVSALDTATVAAYTIRNGDGVAHITGIMVNGSTAGTLAIKVMKATAGTATIYANSYIKGRRVA